MRHLASHRSAVFALTVWCAAAMVTWAAPQKPHPPTGKLIRTIDSRVTIFYQYKTKDGKYHKAASVSKTVFVKVVKPGKPRTP